MPETQFPRRPPLGKLVNRENLFSGHTRKPHRFARVPVPQSLYMAREEDVALDTFSQSTPMALSQLPMGPSCPCVPEILER